MSKNCDQQQLDQLKNFARDVLSIWPRGDLDGCDLQGIAVERGLLVAQTRHERCGDECVCAMCFKDVDFAKGVQCFGLADFLTEGQGHEH